MLEKETLQEEILEMKAKEAAYKIGEEDYTLKQLTKIFGILKRN